MKQLYVCSCLTMISWVNIIWTLKIYTHMYNLELRKKCERNNSTPGFNFFGTFKLWTFLNCKTRVSKVNFYCYQQTIQLILQ